MTGRYWMLGELVSAGTIDTDGREVEDPDAIAGDPVLEELDPNWTFVVGPDGKPHRLADLLAEDQ